MISLLLVLYYALSPNDENAFGAYWKPVENGRAGSGNDLATTTTEYAIERPPPTQESAHISEPQV